MALSPNKKQIAFYNSEFQTAYIFPSTFDSPKKKIKFSTDDTLMDTEKRISRCGFVFQKCYSIYILWRRCSSFIRA